MTTRRFNSPWHKGKGLADTIIDSENRHIARVQWQNIDDLDERLEISSLIAAAPELYESLAAMLRLWHNGNPDRNAVDRLLNRAESALQKARGGES